LHALAGRRTAFVPSPSGMRERKGLMNIVTIRLRVLSEGKIEGNLRIVGNQKEVSNWREREARKKRNVPGRS